MSHAGICSAPHPVVDNDMSSTGISFAGAAYAPALRKIWREKGGSFHGPNVETGSMPESDLLPFLHALIEGRTEAGRECAAAADRVYVPGAWCCAKCKLEVIATNINLSGNLGADNRPHQCPNNCGPMWRVTERDARKEAQKLFNDLHDQHSKLKQMYASACVRLAELGDTYVAFAEAPDARREPPQDSPPSPLANWIDSMLENKRKQLAEVDEQQQLLRKVAETVRSKDENARYIIEEWIEPLGLAVRVCEGGGPEDIQASLAVSVQKLVEAFKKAAPMHGQTK